MELRHLATISLFTGILYTIVPSAEGANILFFFGVSTYSHRIIAWPLVEALAERNHSVTFLQLDKNKQPHPKVIDINPSFDGIMEKSDFMNDRLKLGHRPFMLKLTYSLPQLSTLVCDGILRDPKILEWINRNKFDLIFIDGLFNECAYGIAHKMGAKTAIFATSHPFCWLPDALGYPAESWWLAEIHFSFDLPLSFVSRVWSTLSIFYFNVIRHMAFPNLENIMRETLQLPDMPSIPDMMANTSLVLTNTHFSEELARSLPPNVVPIGGMNCIERSQLKSLPKEYEDFIMRGGDDGFILVSFGSGARIADAPEDFQDVFIRTFEKMNMQIIWKWEGERPKRMPANVLTSKWIPQQALLAHPKIRAFLTHGGLLSMHESICHQVPMIVFSVFAEQDYNAERIHRTGRGIRLEISTLTQENLEDAITKILFDHSYKKNVMQVTKRFFDRPQGPTDTAVWWTEYILRHEDTSFMRPLAVNLTWYQRRLLDVWAFLCIIVLISAYITIKITKSITGILGKRVLGGQYVSPGVKVKTN